MPSIRLMGFAAGTLFILSSAGHAQTPQAPGKALPTGQAPSKVLPHPQVSGKGLPAGYSDAGSTGYYDASGGYGTAGGGYYGGGYAGGTAGYPGGYDYRSARLQPGRPRRADVRAGRPPRRGLRCSGCGCGCGRRTASAGRRPGSGCGPAWCRRPGPRALTLPRCSDHPQRAPRPGPTGVRSGRHCGGRMMGSDRLRPIGPPHEIPSVEHDLGALASPNLGNRVTVFGARRRDAKPAHVIGVVCKAHEAAVGIKLDRQEIAYPDVLGSRNFADGNPLNFQRILQVFRQLRVSDLKPIGNEDLIRLMVGNQGIR